MPPISNDTIQIFYSAYDSVIELLEEGSEDTFEDLYIAGMVERGLRPPVINFEISRIQALPEGQSADPRHHVYFVDEVLQMPVIRDFAWQSPRGTRFNPSQFRHPLRPTKPMKVENKFAKENRKFLEDMKKKKDEQKKRFADEYATNPWGRGLADLTPDSEAITFRSSGGAVTTTGTAGTTNNPF